MPWVIRVPIIILRSSAAQTLAHAQTMGFGLAQCPVPTRPARTGVPNADNAAAIAPYPVESNDVCPICAGVGTRMLRPRPWTTGTKSPCRCSTTWQEHLDGIQGVRPRTIRWARPSRISSRCGAYELEVLHQGEPAADPGADLVNSSNGTATDATTYDANKPVSPENNLPMVFSSGDPDLAKYFASPLVCRLRRQAQSTTSPISRACRKARSAAATCATWLDLTVPVACMRIWPVAMCRRCRSLRPTSAMTGMKFTQQWRCVLPVRPGHLPPRQA